MEVSCPGESFFLPTDAETLPGLTQPPLPEQLTLHGERLGGNKKIAATGLRVNECYCANPFPSIELRIGIIQ